MAVWLRINTVGEFGPWTVMIVTIVKDRYMVLPTDPADIKNPGSVVHGQ